MQQGQISKRTRSGIKQSNPIVLGPPQTQSGIFHYSASKPVIYSKPTQYSMNILELQCITVLPVKVFSLDALLDRPDIDAMNETLSAAAGAEKWQGSIFS